MYTLYESIDRSIDILAELKHGTMTATAVIAAIVIVVVVVVVVGYIVSLASIESEISFSNSPHCASFVYRTFSPSVEEGSVAVAFTKDTVPPT